MCYIFRTPWAEKVSNIICCFVLIDQSDEQRLIPPLRATTKRLCWMFMVTWSSKISRLLQKKAALGAPHVWHYWPFKLLDKITEHGFHTALSSVLLAAIGRCKTSVYSEIIDFTNQAIILCLRLFVLKEMPFWICFTIVTINDSQLFSIKQKKLWCKSEEWEVHLFPSEIHQK